MIKQKSSKIRVLLICDRGLIRDGLREIIEAHPNMNIIAAKSDKSEILSVIDLKQPDIILLSADLKGENAVELMGEILAAYEEIRVIILTNACDVEMNLRVIGLGAMGVFPMEHTGSHLTKAIERVYSGEVWMTRSLTAGALTHLRRVQPSRKIDGDAERIKQLTGREKEIVNLIAEGLTTSAVAQRLFICEKTVRNHLVMVYSKLGVSDRVELVLFWLHNNKIKQPSRKIIA